MNGTLNIARHAFRHIISGFFGNQVHIIGRWVVFRMLFKPYIPRVVRSSVGRGKGGRGGKAITVARSRDQWNVFTCCSFIVLKSTQVEFCRLYNLDNGLSFKNTLKSYTVRTTQSCVENPTIMKR